MTHRLTATSPAAGLFHIAEPAPPARALVGSRVPVVVWVVGGRKRTEIVEQTWREAVNVQTVLAEHMARLGLDVVPILCIHGSALPVKTVQGGRLVGPRGLKKLIGKAKPVLSEEDVRSVAEVAERGLRE